MNPIKIVGGLLILLGVLFRAVSIAYFNLKFKALPADPRARRAHYSKKQRALLIDYGFIAVGVYLIVTH